MAQGAEHESISSFSGPRLGDEHVAGVAAVRFLIYLRERHLSHRFPPTQVSARDQRLDASARSPVSAPYPRALMWFRRDLRDHDNAAFFHALRASTHVYCAFVFDRAILDALTSKSDRRVEFIWESVTELKRSLQAQGGDVLVRYGRAEVEIPKLAQELGVAAVFANEDYEPSAILRDTSVASKLREFGAQLLLHKDQVIFARDEVLTQAGGKFSVFTPYKNAWLKKLEASGFAEARPFDLQPWLANDKLARTSACEPMPSLEAMGFSRTNLKALGVPTGMQGGAALLLDFSSRVARYKEARDFPSVKGVSYLSVHNRFGTVSIRELVGFALKERNAGGQTWLSELIWRDFYFQILANHPHVVGASFKPEYDAIQWSDDERLFAAWCKGETGYPIVDAAMRQINQTGYMHNRLRMIAASFLVKDLLIDWRWGEQYFADQLIDFDLAANNGGWQWAASTGCDAQPYFRIFNPVSQSERFDPQGKFIRRYVPELAALPDTFIHAPWTLPPVEAIARDFVLGRNYPKPIVDHAVQREKALALFKAARTA